MRMKAQRKKKMARPAGRTVKPVRRVRAKKTTTITRPATPVRAPRTVTLSSRASLMAAMVVVTGAAILAARGVPSAPETPATDLHLEAAAPPDAFVIVPEADAAERVIARAPAPEAKTVVADAPTPPAPPAATEAAPPAAAAAPVPDLAIETPIATTTATTTVAGCLTFDDGSYRLKDATGTDAPKSRSWKSGFLKKNTVTIDIVDARHSLSLPSYVGQRVEVGGTLLEREMQAHSLQRLAESCKK